MIDTHNMKPCPFCGCVDLYHFIYPFQKQRKELRGCFVACQNCGASTGKYETIEQARNAWNERKGSNAQ